MAPRGKLTDEEIVEEDVGGTTVAEGSDEDWTRIAREDLIGAVHAIAEAEPESAYDAIAALLAPYGITPTKPPHLHPPRVAARPWCRRGVVKGKLRA